MSDEQLPVDGVAPRKIRPGGSVSDSTSVTKPYLYSVLTNSSIVSVAVLIVLDTGWFGMSPPLRS